MINQLNFRVKGYEYSISIPTVGKYYDIEASKQILGKGFYNSIQESRMQTAANAAQMIDIEAELGILIPKMFKDLKVTSFKDLGVSDYLELKKAYDEQFVPWWNDVLIMFNPPKKSEDEVIE